jgi:DNA-binding GntR family transcriptional regulator
MSGSRVVPLKDELSINIALSKDDADKYDKEFCALLLDDMKNDVMLNLFLIRMRYECEVVKTVINKATSMEILELEDIIAELNSSSDFNLISKFDTEFHKRLFAIAGDMGFFKWWREQSKQLGTYMNNYWKSVGYQTARYKVIIDIHKKIFEAIKEKNTEQAIRQMEKHFSFVVVELVGSLYDV